MPISPTVNSFMTQNQMANNPPSDQIFRSKFTEAAFSTLRAKYPNLASLVIALKVIEADVDKGFALAAFILRAAKDVRYIPVVMVDGSIASCEMVYDKGSQQLLPLSPKVSKDIAAMNSVDTATLLDRKPAVDSTKNLFHDIIRPPVSSNPVLASTGIDIAALPNSAKRCVYQYLESNPQVLGKIAEFYPVDVLAEKLAEVEEPTSLETSFPDVISMEDLYEQTAHFLTKADKEAILKDGYTVTKELPTNGTFVFPTADLSGEIESKFNLVELLKVPGNTALAYVGTGYKMGTTGITSEQIMFNLSHAGVIPFGGKILISPDDVSATDHNHRSKQPEIAALVSDHRLATSADLLAHGAIPISRLDERSFEEDTYVVIFFPKKKGFGMHSFEVSKKSKLNKSDGYTSITPRYSEVLRIFTQALNYGCVATDDAFTFPMNSLVGVYKRLGTYPYIRTLQDFTTYIKRLGKRIRILQDGPTAHLNTGERFNKTASLAQHLVSTYGLGRIEVAEVLKARDAYVFNKTAFLTQPAAVDQPAQVLQAAQPSAMSQPQAQQFNPQVLQDFMQLQDQEMFDTGMVASFVGDSDIKANFVDLLPNFLDNLTALGRVILICTIQKKEMEEYYGRERYQTFLTNVRRVFKTLGDIVLDMKEYTNMIL